MERRKAVRTVSSISDDTRARIGIILAVMAGVLISSTAQWLWEGLPYQYQLRADRAAHDRARILVQGKLIIRRPCPGSTSTTWYEGPNNKPELAVRTGHLEHEMVGKSTVIMALESPQVVPVGMEFMPPDWATGIRWLVRIAQKCPEAHLGEFEAGYVEIPRR